MVVCSVPICTLVPLFIFSILFSQSFPEYTQVRRDVLHRRNKRFRSQISHCCSLLVVHFDGRDANSSSPTPAATKEALTGRRRAASARQVGHWNEGEETGDENVQVKDKVQFYFDMISLQEFVW